MSIWSRLRAGGLLGVLLLSLLIMPAGAAGGGQNGFDISPLREDLTLSPGAQGKIVISIKNLSGVDVTAQAVINDFTSDNRTGDPQIQTDTSKVLPTSIRPFIQSLDNFSLKKNEKKKISIPLSIPANASPGAYYGLVRYTAVPEGESITDGKGKVALNASVGTIVLLEIPGNITRKLQVTGLQVMRDQTPDTFFLQAPNNMALSTKNLGNGFVYPFGTVNISGGLGNRQVYSYSINSAEPKSTVLPGKSRTFVNRIKNIMWPGKYTAIASVAYVNGGEVINYKTTFWYIPYWFIGLIVLLALVIAFMVFKIKNARKNPSNKSFR